MIAAIVQARMNSSRLPGKVMKEVLGKPLLFYLVNRLFQSNLIQKIIIATSLEKSDQIIADYVKDLGIEIFRGNEKDVLDRYYQAAKEHNIDIVVRITADCPLIDPKLVDKIVNFYLSNQHFDLVKTGQTYPEGLDTEVFPFNSLKIAWEEANLKSEREHVTTYLWKNSKRFKIKTIQLHDDLSSIRITVDEEVDFKVVKEIIKHFDQKKFFLKDILKLYQDKPEIFESNMNMIRNEGYLRSLKNDLF